MLNCSFYASTHEHSIILCGIREYIPAEIIQDKDEGIFDFRYC